ncbi:FAD-dependent oxidoreductase [Embleya sp. AB8]|uniref:FAD-dependent oxidoreductase n=1 Tax=Embleya sp. AB8 TaxID=3156304 RepID=UPI003C73B8A6
MEGHPFATPANPADAPPRHVDEVRADLVVVGGGLAGLCLALAAAREGADTVLVHDRPVLGGNSSSEVRVIPAGAGHVSAWARETGIVEDLLLDDRAANHAQFWEGGLTNSGWDLTLLDATRRQPGLRVIRNAVVRAAQVRAGAHGREIVRLDAVQSTTEKDIRLYGRQFADCTGNGTVGYLAGASWDYGRESRAEFGEPLAPRVRDRATSGSTIMLHARDVGRPVPYLAPEWAEHYATAKAIGAFRDLRNVHRPEFGGFWWLEIGYPYHQITGAEEVRDELLAHALGVWDHLKNHHPERERLAGHALDWIGALPGRRESRRLLGDVVITEWDCHRDPDWPDRIGTAGWYLDLHTVGGLLNKLDPGEPSQADANYRHWSRVPPFGVPLRACYSRDVANLWVGGRCLSATHVALGALRVQQTLGMLGQAVGTAAAYALAHDLTPRAAARPDGPHIDRIQQRILHSDVRIPGLRERPDPRLPEPRAHASSQARFDLGRPDPAAVRCLSVPRAQVFPVAGERLETIEVHVRNDGADELRSGWRLEEIDTLWARDDGRPVAAGIVRIPPGAGPVVLAVHAAVRPGRLHRLALGVAAAGAPGGPALAAAHWLAATDQPPGTTAQFRHESAGGPDPTTEAGGPFHPDQIDIPAYRHWAPDKWTALTLRPTPEQYPYGPDNAINGRHWPHAWPNLWMSDPAAPLPQHLDLGYDPPATFDQVRVRFDTDLNARISSAPGLWQPPQCVSHYRLLVRTGSGADGAGAPWREIHHTTGNHRRLNVISLPNPVTAHAVRLEILGVGAPGARPLGPEEATYWREDGLRATRATLEPGCRVYGIDLHLTGRCRPSAPPGTDPGPTVPACCPATQPQESTPCAASPDGSTPNAT